MVQVDRRIHPVRLLEILFRASTDLHIYTANESNVARKRGIVLVLTPFTIAMTIGIFIVAALATVWNVRGGKSLDLGADVGKLPCESEYRYFLQQQLKCLNKLWATIVRVYYIFTGDHAYRVARSLECILCAKSPCLWLLCLTL